MVDLSHVSDQTMRDVSGLASRGRFFSPYPQSFPTNLVRADGRPSFLQAISLSKAPVIFSHSGARAICDHPRNVPDDVLDLIGPGDDQNNGIV